MTSKNNPLIKVFLVLLLFIIGIGFSVFSTIKQSQASEISNKQQSNLQERFTRTQKLKMEKNCSMS